MEAADKLGILFHTEDITNEILSLLKSPPHGFGKGANPCIDCHIVMVKRAAVLVPKIKASFLITGEVLGERPKSQNRWALGVVEEESGWGNYLLRPLTAKNLAPTLPETKGWVNREKLNRNEIELLRVGRHFRLGKNSRLIVGRNEKENKSLLELTTPDDFRLQVVSFQGPISLLRGEIDDNTLLKAASITCRYSDAPRDGATVVCYRVSGKEKKCLQVLPLEDEELELLRTGRNV